VNKNCGEDVEVRVASPSADAIITKLAINATILAVLATAIISLESSGTSSFCQIPRSMVYPLPQEVQVTASGHSDQPSIGHKSILRLRDLV